MATSESRNPVFLARNIVKYYFQKKKKKSFFNFPQLFNPIPRNLHPGRLKPASLSPFYIQDKIITAVHSTQCESPSHTGPIVRLFFFFSVNNTNFFLSSSQVCFLFSNPIPFCCAPPTSSLPPLYPGSPPCPLLLKH